MDQDESAADKQISPKEQLRMKREAQATRLARLAEERGGLPIDQAVDQAQSERHKEFAKKDMAYQSQTAEESRQHVLERLSEAEDQLSRATEPKEIEHLKKQIEMLKKLAQKFE